MISLFSLWSQKWFPLPPTVVKPSGVSDQIAENYTNIAWHLRSHVEHIRGTFIQQLETFLELPQDQIILTLNSTGTSILRHIAVGRSTKVHQAFNLASQANVRRFAKANRTISYDIFSETSHEKVRLKFSIMLAKQWTHGRVYKSVYTITITAMYEQAILRVTHHNSMALGFDHTSSGQTTVAVPGSEASEADCKEGKRLHARCDAKMRVR